MFDEASGEWLAELIKSIRLTDDAQEIHCKHDGIKGLMLRAESVRTR